jgi:hypothetical protein
VRVSVLSMCVLLQDYGEETQANDVLRDYLKQSREP